MQRLLALLATLTLCFTSTAALAASAEERLAQEYLEAAVKANAERMLGFYHPAQIVELRDRVLKVLEQETASGGNTIRTRLFGVVTSMEEVRRLTPDNLYLRLAARVGLPSEPVKEIKVLGTVEENPQSAHAVARLVPPDGTSARSRVAVVSLVRQGKGWKVAVPTPFQARVDELLSKTDPQTPEAAAPATANTTEIEDLLATSVELLRTGSCGAYFNERMSPRFRANTSVAALKRLVAQCERSVDTRETYIAALEIAKRSAPKYELDGARAVYDMSGKGLPFQRFVLEKIENHWYVAE